MKALKNISWENSLKFNNILGILIIYFDKMMGMF